MRLGPQPGEEIDRDEVVLKIIAVPERRSDGARLASEILDVARTARQDGDSAQAAAPSGQSG